MKKLILLLLAFILLSCQNKIEADLLIQNATIYSVDDEFGKYQAMAIKDGKVFALGKSNELQERYIAKKKIDLDG